MARAFVMYTVAALREKAEEFSYRRYVTESLRLAPQAMCLSAPWGARPDRHDGMTAEEIADEVIEKSGLETQ